MKAALNVQSLGRYIEEEYLAPLEKARDAAKEGKHELALEYVEKAIQAVRGIGVFYYLFRERVKEGQRDLERELADGQLLSWYSWLTDLNREFAQEFEEVLSVLGEEEEKKDWLLCREIAQALEGRYPEEAEVARLIWVDASNILEGLHREVRDWLEALAKAPMRRKRR